MFLACPNFSLLYLKSDPCGIPEDLSVCERCLADVADAPMPGSPPMAHMSLAYLDAFREMVAERLDVVDRWVFPSQSAADYFLRVYDPDPARVEIIEHGSIIRLGRRPAEPDERLLRDEPLRVAFVGLGWSKKGLEAVNELAEAFRGTSVEIHQFGPLKEAASPELHAHGGYDNEHLPELLHRAGIQVVLLPGAYAETFGIVMSEALAAGIPVIGARYGALGERIRENGCGWTIDPMDRAGIRALVERLDRARDELRAGDAGGAAGAAVDGRRHRTALRRALQAVAANCPLAWASVSSRAGRPSARAWRCPSPRPPSRSRPAPARRGSSGPRAMRRR